MHDLILYRPIVRNTIDVLSLLNLRIQGKILSIPSIILTKGLITVHLKLSSEEIRCALDALCEQELLTADKFLQCNNRKVQSYLKYVPENIEDRIDRYTLQRRLLNMDVDVHRYINSLKTIQYATSALRPSNLLLHLLEEEKYLRLHIDLTLKRKRMSRFQNDTVHRFHSNNDFR